MTKILLVEDDKSLREIYGTRLYAEGYDIVSAGDGEEALAMAIKECPDLILSDVMMPKISGFDMLDILRSTTETRDIKVIMMTALSSEDQRQRGESLGADRYLVKSQVGIEDVVRTVHEVLGDAPVGTAAEESGPAPAAPQPVNTTAATPQAPTAPEPVLPQPTAPFSTPRPAGLGDRIIQPLNDSIDNNSGMAELISQELTSDGAVSAQASAPTPESATPQPTAPASNQVATDQSTTATPPPSPPPVGAQPAESAVASRDQTVVPERPPQPPATDAQIPPPPPPQP